MLSLKILENAEIQLIPLNFVQFVVRCCKTRRVACYVYVLCFQLRLGGVFEIGLMVKKREEDERKQKEGP